MIEAFRLGRPHFIARICENIPRVQLSRLQSLVLMRLIDVIRVSVAAELTFELIVVDLGLFRRIGQPRILKPLLLKGSALAE